MRLLVDDFWWALKKDPLVKFFGWDKWIDKFLKRWDK